jgi:hypothetical protein
MNRRHFLSNAGLITLGTSLPMRSKGEGNCNWITPAIKQCQVGIDSDLVPVTAPQQQSEWCWAACISMIFAYYDHPVSQQRIVKETWGSIVNVPGTPAAILRDLNRHWTDDADDDFRVAGDVFSANAANATRDLADDKPLILGTGGHAVVLTAMSYALDIYGVWVVNSAIVRDPWPGVGRRGLSPAQWNAVSFAVRIRVS